MKEKSTFETVIALKEFLNGRPSIRYYARDDRLKPNSNGDTFVITDSEVVVGFMWYEEGDKKTFTGDDDHEKNAAEGFNMSCVHCMAGTYHTEHELKRFSDN